MSLALPAEPSQASTPARRWAVAGLWLDLAALGGLFLAAALILIWRSDAWPLQLWDESRNANNALEIALHGHWLVPTFDGTPDHWNTKPPLLIWLMAAGLKLGLPPLTAIRLPSWIAAFSVLTMVWNALRFGLQDRAAAAIGGALLLASLAYVGPHAARTGDFDALESLFVTGYVLCGWRVFEDRRRLAWLAATAGFAVLAVLTKGVAGLLATPGLLALAALRWRAALALVRDWRVWALAVAALGLCAGYYLLREALDPGYLRAVLANEIGGRFSAVTENHKGPWFYYLVVLAGGFEPGLPLLACVAVTLRGDDARRRSLALAGLLSGLSLLLVLSTAQSKLDWYVTPMIPLFALAAAIGSADVLARAVRVAPRVRLAVGVAVGIGLAACLGATLTRVQTLRVTSHGDVDGPQFDYARIFARLEAAHAPRAVIAVDSGFINAAGFKGYNPILKFYALREQGQGLRVEIRRLGDVLPTGADLVSCDPEALEQIQDDYRLTLRLREGACVLARVEGEVS
jgi:4-amino-4-deoxy-L-arabinose transferase-like glycosyltransferase